MINLSQAIERIPMLMLLSEPHRTRVASQAVLDSYPQGAHIINMGEVGKDLLFIAQGRAHVNRISDDGKEVILARLGEGDMFGEIAILTGGDRSAFVVAALDCVAVRISSSLFNTELLESKAFVEALLKELALRVRRASSRITDLALLDVSSRLVKILKEMSEQSTAMVGFSRVVHRRPTHKELASIVGTSREIITRTLKKLSQEEEIKIVESKIFLV